MSRRKRARTISCGKRRFRDKREATAALHLMSNTSTRQRIPVRPYECEDCNGWHVTKHQEWR